MRFLADAMLGRLARWLRVIDVDTTQLPVDAHDRDLIAHAADQDRMVLTRDRLLLRQLGPTRSFEITSDVPLEQLADVILAFDIRRPPELLTRCLLCNTPLDVMEPGEARQLVPERSRDLPGVVRRCPSCGRVYWRESHVHRMEAALARALPDFG